MKLHSMKIVVDDNGTLIEVERHPDGTLEACGTFTQISQKQERLAKRYYTILETEARRQGR